MQRRKERIIAKSKYYLCPPCGKWKSADKFGVDASRWNGRFCKCRDCRKAK